MKMLVVGDSHCGPVHRGLRYALAESGNAILRDHELRIVPLGGGHLLPTPFFRDASDHVELTEPTYRRQITTLPPEGQKADAIGLSMPLWPMRVVYQMLRGELCLGARSPGCQLISAAVFRQLVLADQRYVLTLIEVLQRLGYPVVVLSGPGMFRDHSSLKWHDPERVLGLFNAYRQIMLDELVKRNVAILDIPAEAMGEDGFILPHFRHTDPEDKHHANKLYGMLVLEQLLDWMDAQETAAG